MNTATSAAPASAMGKPVIFALAAAAGLTVANIYYNQPMIGLMERELSGAAITYVPTATQLGYAAGLILLVPLGDLIERKRLIVMQCLALTFALALVAIAPSAGLVLAASLLVGLLASVAQQIVPFAANLAPEERRGAVVGTVMAGLLCGILLSRTLAGFVAGAFGWREMFWLAVPLCLLTAGLMAFMLPRSRPQHNGMTYGGLLASLWALWREFPALRLAAYTQCTQFGVFSVFWTILALRLQEPRFGMGPEAAGLFGVLGAAGVLAAPIAGRSADRSGPGRVIVLASALTLVSWLVFGFWQSIAGLVVGVLLMDFSVQASQVSNQSIIYALRPEARSRINTVYMAMMFLAGAASSGAATAVWHHWGWNGVSVLGTGIAAVGLALQGLRRKG
ncbi:MFS transporter [Novosphingobium sp. P6W]|uniref:MFS transporter n=1 Tax=Novosphingobium sp. P6W TaxID=1609758 RepID=UPI0005C30CE0|nr:MFS transporter [Novosphingobium sp. P6W]AXB76230.1 MFS transporter [Novosphingobium sp. P6W]KIS31394.1 MFS transporter [Novosphingobium sp. P6W]